MKAALLISLLVFFVCIYVSISKSPDFKEDGRYEQRILKVGRFANTTIEGSWFNSFQSENSEPNLNGDSILGAVYIGQGLFPVFWISYYTNNRNNVTNGTDFSSLNVSTSASYIVSSYINIEEMTPDNITKKNLYLNILQWTYSQERSDELSNSSMGIYTFVVQGKRDLDPTEIEIQFVTTEKGGLVNMSGDVLVIPKGVESIIIIRNWNYENKNNSLVLYTAIGTSDTTWNNEGSILAGSGSEKVFFYLASEALCDGNLEDVTLTRVDNAEGDGVFKNTLLQDQLKSRYDSPSVELITVKFPPGVAQIEYDPLMGSGDMIPGDSPANEENRGLVIGVSVGVVVGVLLIALIVVIVYRSKRAGYETVTTK